MYKQGKPIRRNSRKAWLVIVLFVAVLLGAIYFIFIKNAQNSTKITNNNSPLITKIGSGDQSSVTINEPLFTMNLPGRWKETSRDSNPSYQSIQWNYVGDKSANRWVRVYTDSIPADFEINYLLPVTTSGDILKPGQMSENCVTFTQGATPSTNRNVSTPISEEKLPARWQKVSFMCDNSHVTHQVVGTGSTEGGNVISITGSKQGKHKYFFVYEDDNYHPDYSLFTSIIESFQAK